MSPKINQNDGKIEHCQEARLTNMKDDWKTALRLTLMMTSVIRLSRQASVTVTNNRPFQTAYLTWPRLFDNAIHWIKLYTVDNAIRFAIIHPPDSNLFVR